MSAKPKGLPSLSINKNADTVDDREKYGLNSPGADSQDMSPNTARNYYGINSPKADDNEDVGNYETANDSGVAGGLITQVPRDQPKARTTTAPEDLMTQVQRPVASAKPKSKKKKGWCSCFSSTPDVDEVNMQTSKGRTPAKPKVTTNNTAGAATVETEEDIQREIRGLLGRRKPEHRNKKTMVLDLDETLVHSSFKPVSRHDFIVPVEIEGITHNVYVLVRPYALEFLDACARHYEVVLFTASLSKYADPLLDLLDKRCTIDYRLFRESCVQIGYSYVKDLQKLGRKMSDIMIVDNSPQSYRFQPNNAIPVTSWFDDKSDTELLDILPCLEQTLVNTADVRDILDATKSYAWLCKQVPSQ